jgi:hypothetical protein
MKIKTFQLFESDEYYHEISDSEVEELTKLELNKEDEEDVYTYIDYREDFTNEEYDDISGFLPSGCKISFIEGNDKVIWITDISYHKIKVYGEVHLCSVSKIRDDYFIVYIRKNSKSYKCDQLDGLEKCIKEKCI